MLRRLYFIDIGVLNDADVRIIPCLTDEAVVLSSFFKVSQPVCVGGVATAGTGGLSDAKTRAAFSDILTYTELGTCHCAERASANGPRSFLATSVKEAAMLLLTIPSRRFLSLPS